MTAPPVPPPNVPKKAPVPDPVTDPVPPPKGFCHQVTQPEMLVLLKTTFIEPCEDGGVAQRDRILSMEDGFECLLRDRHDTNKKAASLNGLHQIYRLCTGKCFSMTFETDPDFVAKLAEVRLPSTYALCYLSCAVRCIILQFMQT
jgi:hypothetical protein